jgi:hypothetical protein
VQLASRLGLPKGLGLVVRCKRWTCFACAHFLRAAWSQNVWDRLHAFPAGQRVFWWRGREGRWDAVRKRIDRPGGHYALVRAADGRLLAVSTVRLPRARRIKAADAAHKLTRAIAAIPRGAWGSKRPVRASHAWKLPDRKTGEWERLGQPHDLEGANEVLAQMGVVVIESSPRPDAGLERRYCYTFPEDWTEDHIDWAIQWAASTVVPPGYTGGPPPDPAVVLAPLIASEGLLPVARPKPAPPAAPAAPPPPAAAPRVSAAEWVAAGLVAAGMRPEGDAGLRAVRVTVNLLRLGCPPEKARDPALHAEVYRHYERLLPLRRRPPTPP